MVEIDIPGVYDCDLSYYRGHHTVTIRASKDPNGRREEEIHIAFSDTLYFCAPARWRGSLRVTVAPMEEMYEIHDRLVVEWQRGAETEYKLYKMDTPAGEVKVLAFHMAVTDAEGYSLFEGGKR